MPRHLRSTTTVPCDLIAKVEQFASDARGGLYLLDQELAARVYTAPVQA